MNHSSPSTPPPTATHAPAASPVPPLTLGQQPQAALHQPTPVTPMVTKGCGIVAISIMMMWMLPLLAVVIFLTSEIGGGLGSARFFMLPVAISIFILAVLKIATSGPRSRVEVVAPSAVPSPLAKAFKGAQTFSEKQAELFRGLAADSQLRHSNLIDKSQRLKQLAAAVDDPETRAQLGPGLEKLQWLHLKFLLAREHLQTHTPSHLHDELAGKLKGLRDTLADASLSEVARKSKQSTLEMTEERLRNLETRQCRLTEIESDLERIESQLDLSLERAALQSSGGSTAFQLDLAERMVDSSELFGSSLPLVHDVDAHFQANDQRTMG